VRIIYGDLDVLDLNVLVVKLIFIHSVAFTCKIDDVNHHHVSNSGNIKFWIRLDQLIKKKEADIGFLKKIYSFS
jgi:hypothetical protein